MTILVIAEHDNHSLKVATRHAVTAAQRISGEIHVLVAGASCAAVWPEGNPEFEKACRDQAFRPGEGLPGYVWQRDAPIWIADLLSDPDFPLSRFPLRPMLLAPYRPTPERFKYPTF